MFTLQTSFKQLLLGGGGGGGKIRCYCDCDCEVTVKRKEENSLDFCPNYVQEFGLPSNFVCSISCLLVEFPCVFLKVLKWRMLLAHSLYLIRISAVILVSDIYKLIQECLVYSYVFDLQVENGNYFYFMCGGHNHSYLIPEEHFVVNFLV